MMGPWCKNPLFSRDSLHKGPIMQICNGFLVVGGISFWTNSQVAIEMRYLNSLVISPTSTSWAFRSEQNMFSVGFRLHVHNISMKEGPRGVGCCAIWDIHPKLIFKPKSHKIWFAHCLFTTHPIILKFCTEHGSYTAVLCAKFQKWLDNRNGCHGWTRRKIWVYDMFWTDILYCRTPRTEHEVVSGWGNGTFGCHGVIRLITFLSHCCHPP